MLSREIMGVFCLGVVGLTALLVAGAALQDLADLLGILRRAKRAVVGVAQGELGAWSVEQTGRAIDADGDEAIAFHERSFKSEVSGGQIALDGKTFEVAASSRAQVWIDEKRRLEALACHDTKTFDEVYAQARKAKGAARNVRVPVRKGDPVWVVGQVEGTRIEPEIVSTLDPVAFCRGKAALIALFIPLELALCALATYVALQPPHFGRTSIVGAVACFAFFLGVTPIAVALRERARRPHEAFIRAHWSRKALQKTANVLAPLGHPGLKPGAGEDRIA